MRITPFAFLLCLGCGSSPASTGSTVDDALDSGSGISADQACSDAAQAQCQKLDACHVNGVALRYGSNALCISRVKANCLTSIGAPDTGRTPANEEACAAAYASATCADFVQNTIAACQPPAGTRAEGRACAYAGQCASAFCAFAPGAACGTCAAPTTPGQSCASSQCADGQTCLKAGAVCQPFGAVGDKCSTTSECQIGLTCVGAVSATATAGTCMTGAEAVGAACDRTTGPQCDEVQGLYCSFVPKATAGSCVKYLTATSGACGYTAGVGTTGSSYTICLGGGQCIVPSGANAGTCVPDALDGKPCDTVNGPGCLTPARCVTLPGATTGTCTLPDPTVCG